MVGVPLFVTDNLTACFAYRITFDKGGVRETASAAIAAVHASEAAEKARQMAIGQTHVPLHLDREVTLPHAVVMTVLNYTLFIKNNSYNNNNNKNNNNNNDNNNKIIIIMMIIIIIIIITRFQSED